MSCKLWWATAFALFVAGCASVVPRNDPAHWIEPAQAVQLAAASPRLGKTGVFSLVVRQAEMRGRIYLDSEPDYRDPRDLTVVLQPLATMALARQYDASPVVALKGRHLLVSGTARRVRVNVLVHGKPTGKYYYQTHIVVSKASQIQVLSVS